MHDIVLLPGMACDAGVWRDQLPALAARHRVAVSDVHARCDTVEQMAAALLAEAAGDRLVLVGASMGGMVALHAALQAPRRVAALALLGSSARADTPDLLRLRGDAINLYAAGRMDEVLRANLLFAFHPDTRRPVWDDYLAMMARAGAAQLVRQNRAAMARPDLRPRLAEVRCPTLVVCGDADRLTPPAVSSELAAGITGARLEIVPGAGHMLTLEQPARVNATLLRWLDAVDAPPAPS